MSLSRHLSIDRSIYLSTYRSISLSIHFKFQPLTRSKTGSPLTRSKTGCPFLAISRSIYLSIHLSISPCSQTNKGTTRIYKTRQQRDNQKEAIFSFCETTLMHSMHSLDNRTMPHRTTPHPFELNAKVCQPKNEVLLVCQPKNLW